MGCNDILVLVPILVGWNTSLTQTNNRQQTDNFTFQKLACLLLLADGTLEGMLPASSILVWGWVVWCVCTVVCEEKKEACKNFEKYKMPFFWLRGFGIYPVFYPGVGGYLLGRLTHLCKNKTNTKFDQKMIKKPKKYSLPHTNSKNH
jgi:hypothetical protein